MSEKFELTGDPDIDGIQDWPCASPTLPIKAKPTGRIRNGSVIFDFDQKKIIFVDTIHRFN
jgi:hypothetical protein